VYRRNESLRKAMKSNSIIQPSQQISGESKSIKMAYMFAFRPTIQYPIPPNNKEATVCVNDSTKDFPRKYAEVLYIFTVFSLR